MRVYLSRTLPHFSCIVLVACLGKVGHSAGAPLGAHVLNGKGLNFIPFNTSYPPKSLNFCFMASQ